MAKWTDAEGREALAAISTLKRALGIPNHPTKSDIFTTGHNFHIYTPDEESAQLIGELLYRYGNGRREAFYNSRPDIYSVRDTVRVKPLEEGGYETAILITYAPNFTKALQKMVEKHIAPDNGFSR